MKKKILKYIKMIFLLLLLFEGVVPHYHILNKCVGHCMIFNFGGAQSKDASFSTSEHIVVHGVTTMLKENDNIIDVIIAVIITTTLFFSLRFIRIKNSWRYIFYCRRSLYNYILVVYLFFRPPPITA